MHLLLGVLSSGVATAAVVDADVCIYGGTSAGVIAAVQVAAMGKRVPGFPTARQTPVRGIIWPAT